MNQKPETKGSLLERREFLVLSAATLGGVLVYTLDRLPERVSAAQPEDSGESIHIPLRFFTQDEALIVAAAAARIFPSDESGPGAREAGVVIYIDRQLAGPWGQGRNRYMQGPFEEGGAPPAPQDVYRDGLKGLAGFDQLSGEQQDQKLKEIENGAFFAMLRRNTIEGMFCDPIHGGNVDMVGWQWIGFPGTRMTNLADVDKHFGETYSPKPQSLRDVTNVKIRLSEDPS